MYDPNKGRFNVAEAESVLGITEEEREAIRVRVVLDLLLAHAGITPEQVDRAYAERIRNDLRDTAVNLANIVGDED